MADQAETNNESIFNGESVTATPESTETIAPSGQSDSSAETLLQSIVAEDGRQKYSSVADALKALQHSQSFIETLKDEKAALTEEVSKRQSAEEVLEQLKQGNFNDEVATQSSEFDVTKIESLIEQKLRTAESQKAASLNVEQVKDSLTAKFGDKAEEIYIKAANDSGISLTQLNTLSATSPKAVLKLVGIDSEAPQSNFSTGSVNTQSLRPSAPTPSAKVTGGSTSAMVSAWRAARELSQ
jgi:hypothetical protein